MSLLIDHTGAIPDRWMRVEGDAALPEGPAIVDLERLPGLSHAPLGVHLPNSTDIVAVVPEFGRLALVSVAFPAFTDGRGFSIGKRLREHGYAGRLRASGPVIADQFSYLLECGFDEVLVPEAVALRQPVGHWLASLARIGMRYQQGETGYRTSILEQRRAANA